MEQLKRATALLVLVICGLVGMPVLAQSNNTEDITPYYNNASTCYVDFTINSTGTAKATTAVSGKSVTTKIVIETYVDKKILGFIWVRVNNGQTNNTWTDTVYDSEAVVAHTLKLTDKGNYRAKVKITVSGTGGAADVINDVQEATYA